MQLCWSTICCWDTSLGDGALTSSAGTRISAASALATGLRRMVKQGCWINYYSSSSSLHLPPLVYLDLIATPPPAEGFRLKRRASTEGASVQSHIASSAPSFLPGLSTNYNVSGIWINWRFYPFHFPEPFCTYNLSVPLCPVSFCPYTIFSNFFRWTILFVCRDILPVPFFLLPYISSLPDILSEPFCPIPFCPITVMLPWHCCLRDNQAKLWLDAIDDKLRLHTWFACHLLRMMMFYEIF